MVYCLFTQRPGEDIWHYNAITGNGGKDHVTDDKTLWYMSHIGVRYRVRAYEEWGPGCTPIGLISDTIYEPDEKLARKWEEYLDGNTTTT